MWSAQAMQSLDRPNPPNETLPPGVVLPRVPDEVDDTPRKFFLKGLVDLNEEV
jgi:hypothetical protein